MKPREHPAVAPWLTKAAEDLATIELLSLHGPHLADAIRFFCQQAAEKSLKGLMMACDIVPPHIHDLSVLHERLIRTLPTLTVAPEDCALLTPLAVLPRYPRGRFSDVAPVEDAVAACRRIVAAVAAAFAAADA